MARIFKFCPKIKEYFYPRKFDLNTARNRKISDKNVRLGPNSFFYQMNGLGPGKLEKKN